ncbi:MAG TPA: hypothetical protein VEL47_02125 [Myxococcota bacterium]|nr:hypothetical protein [Myxococcota bacterium]
MRLVLFLSAIMISHGSIADMVLQLSYRNHTLISTLTVSAPDSDDSITQGSVKTQCSDDLECYGAFLLDFRGSDVSLKFDLQTGGTSLNGHCVMESPTIIITRNRYQDLIDGNEVPVIFRSNGRFRDGDLEGTLKMISRN